MVITNTGTEATVLYPFTITPSNYTVLSHTCSSGLNPGQSCTVTMRFNPAGYGDGSVNGTIGINAYGAPSLLSKTAKIKPQS